jgi:lysophospholipase L1-like esterase
VLAFLAVAAFAGCASGGGNAVLTPPPKPPELYYTAIGASDAVGYGASVPCTKAVPPNGAADPSCFGKTGTGYVPDLARKLASIPATVTLDDLGYSGAVLGADIRATVNTYGLPTSATPCFPVANQYPVDFITYELPQVSAASKIVTIFAGGNDTVGLVNAAACQGLAGATATQQAAFLNAEIAAFGTDLAALINGIKGVSPSAKIVIANLPNFALIPLGKAQTADVAAALGAVSTAIDLKIIDPLVTSGIPVVDLLCDPSSYVAANFYSDGFHPDDAGYAVIASLFASQINAAVPAVPQTTCSYATTLSKLRQTAIGRLRGV